MAFYQRCLSFSFYHSKTSSLTWGTLSHYLLLGDLQEAESYCPGKWKMRQLLCLQGAADAAHRASSYTEITRPFLLVGSHCHDPEITACFSEAMPVCLYGIIIKKSRSKPNRKTGPNIHLARHSMPVSIAQDFSKKPKNQGIYKATIFPQHPFRSQPLAT